MTEAIKQVIRESECVRLNPPIDAMNCDVCYHKRRPWPEEERLLMRLIATWGDVCEDHRREAGVLW